MKNTLIFVIIISLCTQGDCGFWSSVKSKLKSLKSIILPTESATSWTNTTSNTSNSNHHVVCYGYNSLLKKLPFVNMDTDSSNNLHTNIYFASRKHSDWVQMSFGDDFNLTHCDFDPNRKTVLIVHGFMSSGNISWVKKMSSAYLKREDVNALIVDWSTGGRSWRYWRAVANTRGVGQDIQMLISKLVNATGASPKKNFHLIGHSLGAHICSYVSNKIGGVYRITGLDPAMPCYDTSKVYEQLDKSDATFVDVIHTNVLNKFEISFGIKKSVGHVDFYVNGGDKQPGCENEGSFMENDLNKISGAFEAICSHGRSHDLFVESLMNNNCTFMGYEWKYGERVNASLTNKCELGLCAVMGVDADSSGWKKEGTFYVPTTSNAMELCPSNPAELLSK